MAIGWRNPNFTISLVLLSLALIVSADVIFEERFDDGWENRWVKSDWKRDEGMAGQWNFI